MDNNQNNVFGGQPQYKAPSRINVLELIAGISACISLIMVILGTVFTCTCSAKRTFEASSDGYSMSPVFIVTIFGVIFAIAAIILAIMAIKNKNANVKAGKISQISFVIGCFSVLIGLIPMITICGYNCSLQNKQEELQNKDYDDFDYDDFDFSDWY